MLFRSKGFIERYQVPTNKKEIYFRLTDLGRRAYDGHVHYHSRHSNSFYDNFNDYNEEQKDLIIKFVDDYTANIRSMVEEAEGNEDAYADMDV